MHTREHPIATTVTTLKTPGVEAVARALKVLAAFDADHETMSLHQLASRTGMYKSTLLRLCVTLEQAGFLRRDPDGVFTLGFEVRRLGQLAAGDVSLGKQVYPVLHRLVAATGECATFYVLDGKSRVCLFRRFSTHRVRHLVEEGERLPLDKGAAGKVLLAFSNARGAAYDAVRERGYAHSFGEIDSSLAAIAVPVFGAGETLCGALGISGLAARFTPAFIAKATRTVLREAGTLSERLGSRAAGRSVKKKRAV